MTKSSIRFNLDFCYKTSFYAGWMLTSKHVPSRTHDSISHRVLWVATQFLYWQHLSPLFDKDPLQIIHLEYSTYLITVRLHHFFAWCKYWLSNWQTHCQWLSSSSFFLTRSYLAAGHITPEAPLMDQQCQAENHLWIHTFLGSLWNIASLLTWNATFILLCSLFNIFFKSGTLTC